MLKPGATLLGATVLALTRRRARRFASTVLPAPEAEVRPEMQVFGVVEGEDRGEGAMSPVLERVDDYKWMRDDSRTDEAVLSHLRGENEHCASWMARVKPLQKALFAEFKSRVKPNDSDVPYADGDTWAYASRWVDGKDYPILTRWRQSSRAAAGGVAEGSKEEEAADGSASCAATDDGMDGYDLADGQVVLDINSIAAGKSFCDVHRARPSPDHRLIAYTVDFSGYEKYELRVVDAESGKQLPTALAGLDGSFEWGADSASIYYVTVDEAMRPHKLWLHTLGQEQASDACLCVEEDEHFRLGIGKSSNGELLLVEAASSITEETSFIDLRADSGSDGKTLTVVQPREEDHRYDVDAHGDWLYIVTNSDGAVNGRLVRAPLATPGKEHWQQLLPYNAAHNLLNVFTFQRHVVVAGRAGGLEALFVLPVDGSSGDADVAAWAPLSFPSQLYSVWPAHNRNFNTDTLRVHFSSPVQPPAVLDVNLHSRSTRTLKQDVIPGYNAEDYACERQFATASDGTRVPMSLVWRRDARREGKPMPTLLYGYGSYGICIDPSWSSSVISLLDRGMVYAIAHIRGGGEMGREWQEQAKFLHKRTTFTDFIACADHLVDSAITTPSQLAIQGGSAGGLLMGAVVNSRPELFKAVLAAVPFVDVMNTMADPSIPLTVIEWEQWGNPNLAKYHDYMASYSPYDNVAAKDYPAMLVTSGLWDPRVAYWEPAKWVAKLRRLKTDRNPLLLKMNMSQGHMGSSGRFGRLEERAHDWAFLLHHIL